MKGCEPVHIQYNAHDKQIMAVNTSRQTYNQATAVLEYLTTDGKVHATQKTTLNLPANTKQHCFEAKNCSLPGVYFTRLRLIGQDGTQLSENLYWNSNDNKLRFFSLDLMDRVTLKTAGRHTRGDGMVKGVVRMKNPARTVAFSIKLNARNPETGERILPAYFDDGYFSIFPGEEKEVHFEIPESVAPETFVITAEGYNLDRQVVVELKK
jgi:hypothetical protein